jgi:predicted N-acetyltransferase YhbS
LTDLRGPVPLSDQHDLGSFSSVEPDLDDWLRNRALENRRMNVSATWVYTTPDDRVMGYVCMSTNSVVRREAPSPLRRGAPDPVPAFLIGRLAVDQSIPGEGVGTYLVGWALASSVATNERAAHSMVTVHALHERARDWWERFGFKPVTRDPECMHMYKPTADIEATLATMEL